MRTYITMEKKTAFRNAMLAAMDGARVDAIVYPTWSNPPRKIGDMQSPAGDNSQILSPQTSFPAITVPMGYTDCGEHCSDRWPETGVLAQVAAEAWVAIR